MSDKRPWNIIAILFAVVLMGGLSSAAWQTQQQGQPISEEERKRVLDNLMQQMQSTAKQPPSAPQQPQVPGATPASAPVAPPRIPRDVTTISLNLDDHPLYDFINQIADILGLSPVVIDPEVKGTVTIHMGSLPKDDILPIVHLLLRNNNAALIKQGGVYQILPISSAIKRGIDIIEHAPLTPAEKPEAGQAPEKKSAAAGATEPAAAKTPVQAGQPAPTPQAKPAVVSFKPQQGDNSKIARLATHVIRPEFVPIKDLIEPIKLFMTMTEGGSVMAYERLNMLIVTDYADNIEKIIQVIQMLDNNYLDPNLVELIQIKNNLSADVADDLKKIFGSGAKDSPTGISFVSLDRINSIFVITNSKRGLTDVKRWIAELDASSGRTRQTFRYKVENSTASNIAMVLSALYGGEGNIASSSTESSEYMGSGAGGSSLRGSQFSGSQSGGSRSLFSGSGLSGRQSGQYESQGGEYQGGNIFSGGQQLGPRLSQTPTVSSIVLRGGEFSGLQNTVRVVVDDINNSLIFQATPADYAYISETIKEMDIPVRQALIDTRVYEVELTDDLGIGFSGSLQALSAGPHMTTAGVDANSKDTVAGTLSASSYIVLNSREILLKLNALQQKSKVRILEAPSVLALDGKIAHISVGSDVPYPGTSYVAPAGGSTTSVQYRETGITLLVEPRISASGSVMLKIAQEVSSPGATTTVGPVFAKTLVETTAAVKDGETVAIAGLIRNSQSNGRAGVPFLSQIPILGGIFGSTIRNGKRTELIILITPHVIQTPDMLQEMTQDLKDSLKNVRKMVRDVDREQYQNMEDAREERYREDQELLKKNAPPKPMSRSARPPVQPAEPPEEKKTE